MKPIRMRAGRHLKNMKNLVYELIFWTMRRIIKKPEIAGTENIEQGVPAVFVSNHLAYYGPLKLMLFSNLNFAPWVAHEIADKKLCGEYLMKHFLGPTFGRDHALGSLTAAIIAPVCVGIMHYIEAVPVYGGSRKVLKTIEVSISQLEKGRNLLVFPEIEDIGLTDRLGEFNTGFVNIAKYFYERCSQKVNFYPVCVNKAKNRIEFGRKIEFNPENTFHFEKKRIVSELENGIKEMLNY